MTCLLSLLSSSFSSLVNRCIGSFLDQEGISLGPRAQERGSSLPSVSGAEGPAPSLCRSADTDGMQAGCSPSRAALRLAGKAEESAALGLGSLVHTGGQEAASLRATPGLARGHLALRGWRQDALAPSWSLTGAVTGREPLCLLTWGD